MGRGGVGGGAGRQWRQVQLSTELFGDSMGPRSTSHRPRQA